MEQKITTAEEWTPGQDYRLTFTVDAPAIYTTTALREKVDSAVRHLAEDHRLRVNSYTWSATTGKLIVNVTAMNPSSPILIIVAAVLAIGALFGLKLVLDSLAKVVKAPGDVLDAGTIEIPLGTNPDGTPRTFKLPLVAVGVTVAGIMVAMLFLRRG